MSIENVIAWYEKNVNYKLTKAFVNFMIKTGIINNEIDLNLLNLFLLEFYGNDFVKENGKFKIKENRKVVIDNFNNKETVVEDKKVSEPKIKITKETKQKEEPKKSLRNKFKIESLGGKKLKLVKL